MLVVNLFGGPGCGKSTTMAGVFYELKRRGVLVEMAPEWVKEKVWEESTSLLNNQIYIFGKQYHRLWRLIDKVRVVITDSPLLLNHFYGKDECSQFHALVDNKVRNMFNNENILLTRAKEYVETGRMQSEDEAESIDEKVLHMLNQRDHSYTAIAGDEFAVNKIVEKVLEMIKPAEKMEEKDE